MIKYLAKAYNVYNITPTNLTAKKGSTISYKKITKERLEWGTTNIIQLKHATVLLNASGHVDNLESTLDNIKELQTIAVNVGTGRGKTTSIYRHVANLQSNKEVISILATPYKQLVTKDVYGLVKAGVPSNSITSYIDVQKDNEVIGPLSDIGVDPKEPFFKKHIKEKTVHVISINSLLHNSGNEAYELRRSMRIYLDLLYNHCKKNNLKIHLFIDEIHESVVNLQSKYVSELWKYKPFLSKVVVASATFSEPALTALAGISSITDNKVLLYQLDRAKFPNPSCNLHLVFTNEKNYAFGNKDLVKTVEKIINQSNQPRSHILCYSKSLSKFLNQKVEFNAPKNLCIGSDDSEKESNPFTDTMCNIGTTFITGVDIPYGDDLIIVLPSNSTHLGMFSSGSIAVQQAIARARKSSNVYIILPKLEATVRDSMVNMLLKKLKVDSPAIALDYNASSDDLEHICEYYVNRYSKTVQQLPNYTKNTNVNQYSFTPFKETVIDWENKGYPRQRFHPTIPSIDDFIVDVGQQYLVGTQVSSGKGIAPYLLWLVANDQITHCTLKSCWVRQSTQLPLSIDDKNYCNQLDAFCNSNQIVIAPSSKSPTIDDFYNLIKDIWKNVAVNGVEHKVNLTINNLQYSRTKENKLIASLLWNYAMHLHNPKQLLLDINNFEEEYFQLRISSVSGSSNKSLDKQYFLLRNLLSQINFPKSGITVTQKNDRPKVNGTELIDDILLLNLYRCLSSIKLNDLLLKSNGFTHVLKELPKPVDPQSSKRLYVTIKNQFFKWDQKDPNKLIGIKYI